MATDMLANYEEKFKPAYGRGKSGTKFTSAVFANKKAWRNPKERQALRGGIVLKL